MNESAIQVSASKVAGYNRKDAVVAIVTIVTECLLLLFMIGNIFSKFLSLFFFALLCFENSLHIHIQWMNDYDCDHFGSSI